MKRTTLLSILVASLTLGMVSSSFAQSVGTSKQSTNLSKTLNVVVDYYLSVSFADGSTNMTLTIADGGQAGAYDSSIPTFTILTNDLTTVTPSFTNSTPTAAPGTWSALVSSNGTTYVATYNASTGTSTGYLKAHVSGLGLTSATAGSYATTVTVTFAQQ